MTAEIHFSTSKRHRVAHLYYVDNLPVREISSSTGISPDICRGWVDEVIKSQELRQIYLPKEYHDFQVRTRPFSEVKFCGYYDYTDELKVGDIPEYDYKEVKVECFFSYSDRESFTEKLNSPIIDMEAVRKLNVIPKIKAPTSKFLENVRLKDLLKTYHDRK